MPSFDRVIPPGGEGKITLRIKTTGYRGQLSRGAKIYSNDPNRAMETVRVTFSVKILIDVMPRYVYLRGMAGQVLTRVVTIRTEVDRPLTLTTSRFDLEKKVKYTIEEVQKGKLFRIHISNIPGTPLSYRGVLELRTNYPEKPIIRIPISATFKEPPPVNVSPSRVMMKGVPGQIITKMVKVTAGKDLPLTLKVEGFGPDERMKYRIEETEAGKSYVIYITNVPGGAEVFSGSLRLKTNYPEKPLITIPIRGVFRD